MYSHCPRLFHCAFAKCNDTIIWYRTKWRFSHICQCPHDVLTCIRCRACICLFFFFPNQNSANVLLQYRLFFSGFYKKKNPVQRKIFCHALRLLGLGQLPLHEHRTEQNHNIFIIYNFFPFSSAHVYLTQGLIQFDTTVWSEC